MKIRDFNTLTSLIDRGAGMREVNDKLDRLIERQ